MVYGIRGVMKVDVITEYNFTKHYFDLDKTKDLIIWLVKQWRQDLVIVDAKPDARNLPKLSSTFRRLFRLICTKRGLTKLDLLTARDKRDEVLGAADDEIAKEFAKNLLEKVSSEDIEQEPHKCPDLKEFFEESLCEYIRFQDPGKKFREIIKNEKSIFHLIGSPKCPIYIRIDLLTELSFRKLRKASEDTLFEIDSRIQTELEEMVEYGDKLSKRIESDYHVDHFENQLLGSPSSSLALFNMRKTLIKVRYCSSPQEVFESAMDTIKLYKYPRDELRAIYGQIWSYHAIMRAHMFRGDEIHVKLYQEIIDKMVECLLEWGKPGSSEYNSESKASELRSCLKSLNLKTDGNKAELVETLSNYQEQKEAERKNHRFVVFGEYLDDWGLIDHEGDGRTHRIPEALKSIQKAFFEDENKNRTVSWNWSNVISEPIKKVRGRKIDPYGIYKYLTEKVRKNRKEKFDGELKNNNNMSEEQIKKIKKEIAKEFPYDETDPSLFEKIGPNLKLDKHHGGKVADGTPLMIFKVRKELHPEEKKKLILSLPVKLEACIDRLLTSKSPLKISYLRLMAREYLLQFTKIACKKLSKRKGEFQAEPYYGGGKIVPEHFSEMSDSFVSVLLQDKGLKKVLDRLHNEFELMEEYIAMKEIKSYIKCIEAECKKSRQGPLNIGKAIQKELEKYICEKEPNSELYFPRKYPRTPN
jgi:hypothetical protein